MLDHSARFSDKGLMLETLALISLYSGQLPNISLKEISTQEHDVSASSCCHYQMPIIKVVS